VRQKTADGKRLCRDYNNPHSKMRSMYDEDRSEIMIVQFLAEHLESHGFQAFQVGTYAPVLSCEDKKKPTLSFSSKRATRSFSSK